jgi:hypothetical protein
MGITMKDISLTLKQQQQKAGRSSKVEVNNNGYMERNAP